MKKLTLVAITASLAACGGNNGTDTADTGNGASLMAQTTVMRQAATTASAASVSSFLTSSFLDGQAEIRLSQLALQKSGNNEVKGFAQHMIDDHTSANNEIRQLAQRLGITLTGDATADQDATYTQLSGLAGDAFDRAYMEHNVTVHETDVAAFRAQARAALAAAVEQQGQQTRPDLQTQQGRIADTQYRTFVTATLPLLQLHLAAAEEINNLLNPDAFLASAYRDSLAEIQLGQLALQKATSADVKSFAQRMIDDHTSLNSRISQLAAARGVALPSALSAEQQATADELSGLSGVDFDRAYMDVNVKTHAVDVFSARRQSQQGANAEVKALALDALPTLAEHFVRAVAIDRALTPTFLYSAAQDSLAEIALGHLALQKSSNANVKTFAQRMIDDHNSATVQAAQLAQQAGRGLPTQLSPEQWTAFIRLYGSAVGDFDNRYMDYNVTVHQRDVDEASAAAQQTSDTPSRTLATTLLPILQTHLSLAQQIQQQLQNAGSTASSGTGTTAGSDTTTGSGTTGSASGSMQ